MRWRFGSNCHRSIVCSERNQISNLTELRGDWTFRCEASERTPSFHIPPVAAFSISPKCTGAVYSLSRSYSISMSFPASLSLYHYFVVAARMQHHFESNLVAVEESGVAALQDPDLAAFKLFCGPRGILMYYGSASLCVVVQGFRNLKLGRSSCRVATCRIRGSQPITSTQLFRSVKPV